LGCRELIVVNAPRCSATVCFGASTHHRRSTSPHRLPSSQRSYSSKSLLDTSTFDVGSTASRSQGFNIDLVLLHPTMTIQQLFGCLECSSSSAWSSHSQSTQGSVLPSGCPRPHLWTLATHQLTAGVLVVSVVINVYVVSIRSMDLDVIWSSLEDLHVSLAD
jgi:hypothetical protein